MKNSKSCANCVKQTLWQADLDIKGQKQKMLFRSTEEFDEASREASALVAGSPGAHMSGAVIVAIERVARLWN